MGFKYFSCGTPEGRAKGRILGITSLPKSSRPNPSPHRFKILRILAVSRYIVAEIHYPDCTTLRGNKVLVYKQTSEWLESQVELDPHFLSDGDGLLTRSSPIARFPADPMGWMHAVGFAKSLVTVPGRRRR